MSNDKPYGYVFWFLGMRDPIYWVDGICAIAFIGLRGECDAEAATFGDHILVVSWRVRSLVTGLWISAIAFWLKLERVRSLVTGLWISAIAEFNEVIA